MLPTCDKCQIRIDEGEFSRSARITPPGFWTDIVTVRQSSEIDHEDDSVKWRDPEVSWGSGGTDGTDTGNALTDNFIEALNHAKEIADEWRQSVSSAQAYA